MIELRLQTDNNCGEHEFMDKKVFKFEDNFLTD